MSKQTIHIQAPINRDDLDAVITGLEAACGGIRIEVSEAFDISVTDERQAAALKALFGGNGQSSVEKVQKVKKPKQIQRRYPNPTRAYHSRKDVFYTFLTGERANKQITGEALHVMLKTGKLEPGTRLSHPEKGELTVVIDGLEYSLQAVPA